MAMMGSDSASDSSSPSAPVDHEADKFKEWVHDEYNDPRADVELVAAGGVVFRVHSHALIKSSTFFKDTIDLASTDGRIRIELDQWEPTTIADYITLSAIPRLTELPVRMSLTDQINIFHFTDFVGNGKLWDVLRMCVARAASPKHLLQIAVQSNDDAYLIDFALRTLYGRLMNAGYDIRQLCVAVHACRLAFQGLPPRYTAALGDRLIRVYSTPTPQTPGWMGWEWLDSCAEMEGFIAAVRGDGEERWFNKKRKASQEV